MMDIPYFMTNEKWYEFDFKNDMYVLTDEAPEKAKESYEEYRSEKENAKKNGYTL